MASRIDRIRARLSELDVDALFLTNLSNIRWACGFTGTNGALLIRAHDAVFLTDGRYRTQSDREVSGVQVAMGGYDLPGYAAEHNLLAECRTAGYQSDHLTVAELDHLRELFADVDWIGIERVLVRDIAVKDDAEIERIRAAQQLTEHVFVELVEWIAEGMTEQEVAAEIVYRHLSGGAERMSFDPIVASGANSALPHGLPTDRRIRTGDVVVLDFGCFLDGFASDMTRTIAVGEPAADVRSAYDLVRAAQEQAIEAARAGISSVDLDGVARTIISDAGYGEFFSHSLGHGIGLQIHEWPRVSYSVDYSLPANCAVTIEPGIYLPGRFGIRIEDIVVLRDGGCENLTRARKDLLVL